MHISIKLDKPIELIKVKPFNPLISKCQIKVCYVSDEPNRNKSVITKAVATELANSIPGSPIVGFYNEEKQDFEEHNRMIDISGGKFEIKDTTKPYGFVSTDAKVWFEWFEDDGVPHEYLMTEGYLWTGQYPECQRIIERGNNQSMELDEDHLDAHWTKDAKGNPEFFIINEAIMSKLCILGEDVEPCFEGASISKVQFSFDKSFQENWANMMNQMKDILNEGGAPVYKYTVDSTSDKATIENYLTNNIAEYGLVECYSEEDQKFAVLQKDDSFYRMNYSYNDGIFEADEPTIVEYSRQEGFDMVRVTEIVETVSCTHDDQGHCVEERTVSTTEKTSSVSGPIDEVPAEPVPEVEPAAEYVETEPAEVVPIEEKAEEEKVEYVEENAEAAIEVADVADAVEEVAEVEFSACDTEEYKALQAKYDELEVNYNSALGLITQLKSEKEEAETRFSELETSYKALESAKLELEGANASLNEFKLSVEREKKQEMINKFYMLDDNDKKDVIDNIDKYSLDDIEAKLCVACFRNHVSFDDNTNEQHNHAEPTVYTLGSSDDGEDLTVPAFIKAVRETQKKSN